MSENLKVTPIEELIKSTKGELVELPPFSENIPFVARLKKPSILAMSKAGKIPNNLLVQANDLFTNGVGGVARKNSNDSTMMDDLLVILDIICEESFVEPTFNELKQNGIELTDEQYLAVFSYTQNGVKSLENFRK